MTDIKLWEKMLLEDIDTSILVEHYGLENTIKMYRNNEQDKYLQATYLLHDHLKERSKNE